MNNNLLPINKYLLSSLIGLIRSFQNNEDLLTNSSYLLVLQSLVTNDIKLIDDIDKEKRRIVPSCYTCEVKCGKTDNYDFSNFFNQEKRVLELKLELLNIIINKSKDFYSSFDLDNINSTLIQPIIDGLFYIGMDEYGEVEINYIILKILKCNLKVQNQ